MSARERILSRLRAAPAAAADRPDAGAWFAVRQRGEDRPQRVVRLRAALEAAHAEVHEAAQNWPEVLLRIAAAKGLRNVLVGGGTAHGMTLAARAQDALRVVFCDQPIEAWRDRLFDDIDAGLSLARGAIAETGSLILWPGESEPRTLSLVPPVHFVLLDEASIHADLHSAMAADRWPERMPTNALLISGPSKTADIQQTLAYGAHGPRELVVLLINEQGGAP